MSEDKNLGNSELNAADELTNAPQEQQPKYRQEKWLPTGRLHVSSAGIKIRGL